MKITFGEHNGKNINALPTGYLKWLSTQIGTEIDKIAKAAITELEDRDQQQHLEEEANEFLKAHGINPRQI